MPDSTVTKCTPGRGSGAARPGATITVVEIAERTGSEEETLVTLTPVAAEKIRELMAEDPDSAGSVLRVAIQGGGCSGFQYGLGFDEGPVDDEDRKSVV